MYLAQGQRLRLTLTAASRRVKSAACLLLGLFALTARAQLAEQEQTGQMAGPDNTPLAYSIRLLPLASFPDIPAPFLRVLSSRGCLIPQTYEAHQPENVIHGSFEKPGSSDVALLCTTGQTTSLLVFFASNPSQPATLVKSKNTDWLAIEGDRMRGFAWGLDPVATAYLPRGLTADHDGISDSFIEHTAKLHYYSRDHWLTVDRNN
ncbi:MAG: hypothetical protein HIU87_01720 [Acidobacteria bacterium]|nr:hypothetical protein [Acidobacteriota bacterium]